MYLSFRNEASHHHQTNDGEHDDVLRCKGTSVVRGSSSNSYLLTYY